MEKIVKKVKVWIVILFVILVSIIAFWGIFKKEKGVWENCLPDYQYGMDIKGARELRYTLDDTEEEKYVYVDENGNVKGEVWKDGNPTTAEEENSSEEGQATEEKEEESKDEVPYAKETKTIKVNADDKLTKENFEIAKKIIQERLKAQEISEFNIRIDDVTGALVIETKNEPDNVETVEELVSKPGKFQMIDYQNGLVLMDNSNIKKASVVSSNESSYQAYLQIEFDKEGSEKLREMSNKYVEIEKEDETDNEEEKEAIDEETTEEHDQSEEEEPERKYISVVLDDSTMMTTYFGEEMTAGMLQIAVGEATTQYDEFSEDYQSAKRIADVLNSGVLPVTYELETDNFVKSEITTDTLQKIVIVGVIVIAIWSILMMVRYKKNGVLATILGIGYSALFSIIIRYTNVVITVNALVAVALMIILNYVFMNLFMKKLQQEKREKAYQVTMKEFYLRVMPVCVIAIVFTLVTNLFINSIGTVVFWGILLNAIYHCIFTRAILQEIE